MEGCKRKLVAVNGGSACLLLCPCVCCAEHRAAASPCIETRKPRPQVRRWDAESGKLVSEAQVHDDAIQDMQLSPDGSYVITASLDKTAQVGAGTGSTTRGCREISSKQWLVLGGRGTAVAAGHAGCCARPAVQTAHMA
jgi:WD40 repeat protein